MIQHPHPPFRHATALAALTLAALSAAACGQERASAAEAAKGGASAAEQPATPAEVTVAASTPLQPKQSGQCTALAPAGWSMTTNAQGSTAELLSPDGAQYAGWGAVGIDRAMQGYYGPMYGDPETSIGTIGGQVLGAMLHDGSGLRYTSDARDFLGYFQLRTFEAAAHRGVVFYKVYPGPAYPRAYVESFYFAIAPRAGGDAALATAQAVAVSIRCHTRLVPSRGSDAGGGGSHGGRSGCGEGNLRGYNRELGWQYAHSASTGENYLMDASADWMENGPQGAGYYRRAGSGYEKLEMGRSDDGC